MRPKPRELAWAAPRRAPSLPKTGLLHQRGTAATVFLGPRTLPAPVMEFCARRADTGNDSSMGFSRHSFQSFGTLDASHAADSVAKRLLFGSQARSMKKLLRFLGPKQRPAFFEFETNLSDQPAAGADEVRANRVLILPYFLRRSFFRILPVPVFGKLSRIRRYADICNASGAHGRIPSTRSRLHLPWV